ncbi:MAG: DUF1080 domain-containing protein [Gemmatimonadetes bacterium]|nr:DUF1080 domain-containing protein [Gemmatimonadota bacterium]
MNIARRLVIGVALTGLVGAGCATQGGGMSPSAGASGTAAGLSAAEQAAGWRMLFNGRDFTGWRGLGRDTVPTAHWRIEDGTIHKLPSGNVPVARDGQPLAGGDLMTTETFGDFELAFEFKLTPGANSGVKYNVSEQMSMTNPTATAALGFEYQVLDDEGHPDAKAGIGGNRTTAGLYDLIAPSSQKRMRPIGEWNEGRIVFRGNHAEHWLNGVKVVEYDLGTSRMAALLAASKYAPINGFADRRRGHIVLQDHNDSVWYRNIKIRPL